MFPLPVADLGFETEIVGQGLFFLLQLKTIAQISLSRY